MAKSTSDKAKTTKTDAASASAEKKPAAKKTTSAKESTTPKAAKAAGTSKASKSSGANSADALAKKCQEAADKFEKLGDSKYADIREKLQWCIGSYHHDKNPSGLVEYGRKAADLLKEARNEKPKQISQKLIDDLEKAAAKV